jgi:hypothetical protein
LPQPSYGVTDNGYMRQLVMTGHRFCPLVVSPWANVVTKLILTPLWALIWSLPLTTFAEGPVSLAFLDSMSATIGTNHAAHSAGIACKSRRLTFLLPLALSSSLTGWPQHRLLHPGHHCPRDFIQSKLSQGYVVQPASSPLSQFLECRCIHQQCLSIGHCKR